MSTVVELQLVTSIRWNSALYAASDGSSVLKVMSIQGDCKVDVARFFRVKILTDSAREATSPAEDGVIRMVLRQIQP